MFIIDELAMYNCPKGMNKVVLYCIVLYCIVLYCIVCIFNQHGSLVRILKYQVLLTSANHYKCLIIRSLL